MFSKFNAVLKESVNNDMSIGLQNCMTVVLLMEDILPLMENIIKDDPARVEF